MKNTKNAIIIASLSIFVTLSAMSSSFAHRGGVNKEKCHSQMVNGKKTYHHHRVKGKATPVDSCKYSKKSKKNKR